MEYSNAIVEGPSMGMAMATIHDDSCLLLKQVLGTPQAGLYDSPACDTASRLGCRPLTIDATTTNIVLEPAHLLSQPHSSSFPPFDHHGAWISCRDNWSQGRRCFHILIPVSGI